MAKHTADEVFRDRYGKNPNVMTPFVHYRKLTAHGRLAVELSSGSGLTPGTMIYGVTVLLASDPEDRLVSGHLSTSFSNRPDADAYVTSLRHWEPGDIPAEETKP